MMMVNKTITRSFSLNYTNSHMRRYYGLVIAFMCCMVIFPSETVAQRAAVGMGSKLKKSVFGGNSFGKKQNSNSAQEGEDNDGEDGDNGMILTTLMMIVTEKPGITLTMLVALVGYVYLVLFQQKKIKNIEQTLASGGGNGSGE